jgi:pyrimidine operon attenuation protein / uracil phosphoribosyltransferase
MAPNKEARQSPVSGVLLEAADISRITSRIAHEIIERTAGQDVVLLGIPSRGAPLAHRIAQRIDQIGNSNIPVGSIDITLHRDDLRLKAPRPLQETVIPTGGIDGKLVILVDDVLFSGRTVRAALDALSEVGRPALVQLAVLVDRGHRELPIRADYVGKNIPTSLNQVVKVNLHEIDGIDQVTLSSGESR